MKDSYNGLIISKVSTLIPTHIKVVDFLMDTLDMGRESAYRRIRNQVPFTLEEVVKLSSILNFSLNEIVGMMNSNRAFLAKSFTDPDQTAESILYRIMEEYGNHLIRGGETDDLEIIVINNRLLFFYFSAYPELMKFFYYRCCRLNSEIPANLEFSKIDLPESILKLANVIQKNFLNIKKEMFIIDDNIYLSLLKEMQYYHFRKLLTDEELDSLKDEFYKFLNYVESLSQIGKNGEDTHTLFYLSSLNIGCNQMFIKYGENSYYVAFTSSFMPIYTSDSNIYNIQRKWIDSLKKYSVLITESNEIDQMEFFRKQYEYLEKLGKEPL